MSQFLNRNKIEKRTLGEKLKQARKRKRLTLEEAEEETKVRIRYLEALEAGDYTKLPADVYVLGFLAKYGDFLGLSKDELTRIYFEEHGRENSPKLLVRDAGIKERRAFLTPRTLVILVGIIGLFVFVGYIAYAVRNFTSAPNLEIQSPSNETVLRQDKVEVIGKTDNGASLKINDQTVYLDDNGNFREFVKLQPGLNNIELKAANRIKKETTKVIKILAEF